MKTLDIEQRSPEWFQAKKGKIGGLRFGQVISNRKNALVYELIDETLADALFPDDYVDEDMQFGIDNEGIAVEKYAKQSGIEFIETGLIISDFSAIHVASPDRISKNRDIVLEVKCTQHGRKQIQRYFEGPETTHLPQIKNYFAVSDDVKEVHWVSYCPFRPERELVVWVYKREDFEKELPIWREKLEDTENEVKAKMDMFCF